MTKRQCKKLDAARGLADPRSQIVAYGSGTGHARISTGLVGLVVGFVVVFVVVLVAVHVALIPGVVLVVVAIGLVRPKRGVARTPDAILVFHESVWNGTPNRLILSAPVASLSAAGAANNGASRVTVLLGTERITLKAADFDRLLGSTVLPTAELPPT
jgi:hypothetical protein